MWSWAFGSDDQIQWAFSEMVGRLRHGAIPLGPRSDAEAHCESSKPGISQKFVEMRKIELRQVPPHIVVVSPVQGTSHSASVSWPWVIALALSQKH